MPDNEDIVTQTFVRKLPSDLMFMQVHEGTATTDTGEKWLIGTSGCSLVVQKEGEPLDHTYYVKASDIIESILRMETEL